MPVQKMTPEEATRLGRNPFSGCKIYCLKKPQQQRKQVDVEEPKDETENMD